MNSQGEEYFRPTPQPEQPEQEKAQGSYSQGKQGGFFNNIKNMFTGGGGGQDGSKGLAFDMDTVFLLVLVYFLLMDGNNKEDDNLMETLLIVGALLFLGF